MTQAQYYTPHPTAAYIAPTQPSNPPINTPNPAPANPVLMFAPANAPPDGSRHSLRPRHVRNSLNGAQTAPLPHRRTCHPTFHPEHPGIDINMHSLEAGKYFYVANPAREEGIYTSSSRQRHPRGCYDLRRGQGPLALACLCWHGHECKRERLERFDAQSKYWALQGSDVICGSRAAVFRLAEDRGSRRHPHSQPPRRLRAPRVVGR
ncbi:hypothetical protein B0H14DRAFT_2576558 [Mycena olivaceomarginata]|nr:hypothetical protein B0H14DRAFT_2576558 [Mycena olivaceomarginata]